MALIPGAVGASPQFVGGTPDVLSFSPSTDTSYTMATTYSLNQIVTVYNSGTAALTLFANDGTALRILLAGTSCQFIPTQISPTTSTHWLALGAASTDPCLNGFINGNFDYWQRGVTFTTTTNGVYSADRFRNLRTGSGTQTFTRDTDTPTAAQSGFKSRYSLKYTQTVAATTGQAAIVSIMEGYNYARFHGKPVRLSFWVKASIAGIYTVAFSNLASTRNYVVEYTINSANTWEKKRIDVVLDTQDAAYGFDHTAGLTVFWNIGNTTSTASPNVWQATSVVTANQTPLFLTLNATFQLSQCMITTDFNQNTFQRAGDSIQGELALCQRYYEKNTPVDVTVVGGVTADALYATFNQLQSSPSIIHKTSTIQFLVQKRAAPTITIYNTANTTAGLWTLFLSSGSTTLTMTIQDITERGFHLGYNAFSGGIWLIRGFYEATSEL